MNLLKSRRIVHPLLPAPFPSAPFTLFFGLLFLLFVYIQKPRSEGPSRACLHCSEQRYTETLKESWMSQRWQHSEETKVSAGWKHPILTWWHQEMGIHVSFPWVLLLLLISTLAEVSASNFLLKCLIPFSLSFTAAHSSFLPWVLLSDSLPYRLTWWHSQDDRTKGYWDVIVKTI